MNIDVQHVKEVKSAECINCQSCVLNCPKAGALESKEGSKAVKPIVVIALVLVVFFGSIFAFQVSGLYKLLPEPLKAGETINLDEIKGYMTINEAAEATHIELKEFYKKFQIPESVPAETMMKEISKTVPGYEFSQIKATLENSISDGNSEPIKK